MVLKTEGEQEVLIKLKIETENVISSFLGFLRLQKVEI